MAEHGQLERIERFGQIVGKFLQVGERSYELNRRFTNVIGVDSSSKMIERARNRVYPDKERVDLRLGELEHLPLKNEEADCAVVSMVLHHLSTPNGFVSEVGRVMKKNGTLVIVDFDKHDDESLRQTYGDRWLGFSKDEILSILDPNGFTMIEDRSFEIGKNLSLNLYRSVLSGIH